MLGRFGSQCSRHSIACFSGGDNHAEHVGIRNILKLGHKFKMPIPAPTRVGVDLKQLWLALRVASPIEADVIAAFKARHELQAPFDDPLLCLLG